MSIELDPCSVLFIAKVKYKFTHTSSSFFFFLSFSFIIIKITLQFGLVFGFNDRREKNDRRERRIECCHGSILS